MSNIRDEAKEAALTDEEIVGGRVEVFERAIQPERLTAFLAIHAGLNDRA